MNTNLPKRPTRRQKSGELDVFDATLYFSGGLDHESTCCSVGQSISPHTQLQSTMLEQGKKSISHRTQSITRDQKKGTTWSISPHTLLLWPISPHVRTTKAEQKKQSPVSLPINPHMQLARPNGSHNELQSTTLEHDNRSKQRSTAQSISSHMWTTKVEQEKQSPVSQPISPHMQLARPNGPHNKLQSTILEHDTRSKQRSNIQSISPHMRLKKGRNQNSIQLTSQSVNRTVSPPMQLQSTAPKPYKRSKQHSADQSIISQTQLQPTVIAQDKRSKQLLIGHLISPDRQFQSTMLEQDKRSKQRQVGRPITPHTQLGSMLERDERLKQPIEPGKRSKQPNSIVAKFASIVSSIFNHTKCKPNSTNFCTPPISQATANKIPTLPDKR